jgi:hypothetical protein
MWRVLFLAAVCCVQPILAQLQTLGFAPVDSDFSKTLGRLILVSANPHQLHIYNPSVPVDTTVALSDAPFKLAVSADGLRAAVLHIGKITIVNLATAQVEKVLTAAVTDYTHVVLGSEYLYIMPDVSIRIATGAATTSSNVPLSDFMEGAVSHPNGKWIYSTQGKFDISTGGINYLRDWVQIGACAPLRYIDGASKIATGCGSVFEVSADPATDMRYVGRLADVHSRFNAFADGTAKHRVAAVRKSTTEKPDADTEVELYETNHFTLAGRRTMPTFGSGPAARPAHIQRVFFDEDATQLITVVFSKDVFGVTQSHGVVVLASSTSGAGCSYSLSKSAVAAPAAGLSDQVLLTTRPDCISEATTASTWIKLASPSWAGGNMTYKFLVEANTTGSSRSGTVTFAPGQSVTVMQAASANSGPITRLPYTPIRTEYSRQLDRLILISNEPPLLHIHDPSAGIGVAIALSKPPVALSVSRDGKFAAVGHDGLITYVNLATATVQQEFRVRHDMAELALAPQGYIHFTVAWENDGLKTLAMATGALTTSEAFQSEHAPVQIGPSGGFLYLLTDRPTKWDIRAGLPKLVATAPVDDVCAPLEFTPDGSLAYDQCGRVLYTSDKPVQDLLLKLTLRAGFSGISYSAALRRLAFLLRYDGQNNVVPPELYFTDDENYEVLGVLTMPEYPGTQAAGEAISVFWSPDSRKLYTVIKATGQATVANNHAVYTITRGQPGPWCTFALNSSQANVAAAGGSGLVGVTTAPSCTWSATTNAPWLRIVGGSPGHGPELIGYAADLNPTTSVRTATITIGTASFSVVQAPGSDALCKFAVTPPSISAGAANQSGALQLTAASTSCAWTAKSSASWAEVYPLSGMGAAAIAYTIYPNFTSVQRTATFTIAGKTVSITQPGAAGTANERFAKMLYFNLLGRMPTPAEIVLQVSAIRATSRAQVAANFFNTAEFNLGGRFIAGLYVGLLNRDAEYSGYLFQRNAMLSGAIAQSALVSNFMSSAEYGLRYGNPSNPEFVRLLYRHILLREAADSEVAFHAANLQAGMTRVTLASNFLNTREFREGTQARLNAFLLFASLMMREPSQAEHGARIAELQAGKTILQAIQEITSSQEFAELLN